MSLCPCGSGNNYAKCCEPLLNGKSKAPTAEALMRSRYTAFTRMDMKYLQQTHHPKTRGDLDIEGTEKWARRAEWLGLEVIDVIAGGEQDDTGCVEFRANYRMRDEKCVLHELADFERRKGDWYYRESRMPDVKQYRRETPKVGRNDPCNCGSGKKYKKCCGAAV